jgi:hypothetical protein
MESPPPYRQKKNNTVVIVLVALALAALCCCGVLGGGAWFGMSKVGPLAKCGISMETIHEAIMDYAEANQGKLPNAATWQDDVKPFYVEALKRDKSSENPFGTLSPDEVWGCEADGGPTGIAFNADLSGKKLDDLKDKSDVVILFEAPGKKQNLSMKYDLKQLEPLPKRFGKPGMFISTIDGHTKLVGANGKEQDMNFRVKN